MSCSWNKRSVQFAFNWNAYGFCSRVWEMPHLLWLRFKGFGCFCSLCGSNWICPIFTRITNQWNLVSRASRCHWAMHLRYHYVKKGSICRFDLAILCFVCVYYSWALKWRDGYRWNGGYRFSALWMAPKQIKTHEKREPSVCLVKTCESFEAFEFWFL